MVNLLNGSIGIKEKHLISHKSFLQVLHIWPLVLTLGLSSYLCRLFRVLCLIRLRRRELVLYIVNYFEIRRHHGDERANPVSS